LWSAKIHSVLPQFVALEHMTRLRIDSLKYMQVQSNEDEFDSRFAYQSLMLPAEMLYNRAYSVAESLQYIWRMKIQFRLAEAPNSSRLVNSNEASALGVQLDLSVS